MLSWLILGFNFVVFWTVVVLVVRQRRIRSAVTTIKKQEMLPTSRVGIMAYDPVEDREYFWCDYPLDQVTTAIILLNGYYGPLKLFWRQGEERPDLRKERLDAEERKWTHYYTTSLDVQRRFGVKSEQKVAQLGGWKIYDNATGMVIASHLDHQEALDEQLRLMREDKISTTVTPY